MKNLNEEDVASIFFDFTVELVNENSLFLLSPSLANMVIRNESDRD